MYLKVKHLCKNCLSDLLNSIILPDKDTEWISYSVIVLIHDSAEDDTDIWLTS